MWLKKIAFIDTVHPVLQEGLEKLGWQCTDFTATSKEQILAVIHDYNGIVIRSRFSMNKDFLDKATALEFIARSGAGMENIDIDYCANRKIELFNAPEGNRNAVAEHALGMLLALFNNLNRCDEEVRKGRWERERNKGVELDGKTIGLIGYGNNGSAFAKKLSGFDVQILAYDKYKTGFGNEFVKESSWQEIYAQADVLSFHIPQNQETLALFDDRCLNNFAKSIYLINLSRGKIVKTLTVKNGIEGGKILGACLDVLEYEQSSFENMFDKLDDLPEEFKFILQSDKVILSPHVGGWTHESYYKLSSVLLEKIENWASESPNFL